MSEFTRLHNIATMISNMKGSPDAQSWAAVMTQPIIKKLMAVSDAGDIDEIMPKQQPQGMIPGQAPGQMPMLPPQMGVAPQVPQGVY